MRYGQLQSNDSDNSVRTANRGKQRRIERLNSELSQFKEELREETKRLLFMIDDLEERTIDA